MNSLLITGYKAFELGILTAKDPSDSQGFSPFFGRGRQVADFYG